MIERLDALGISWEREFCEFGGGDVYITFRRDHPHAMGYHQYEALIYVKVDGVWKHKVFKAFEGSKVPERRRLAVETAQKWAEERLGASEWVAGPFRDSWQMKETRKRAEALLDEMGAS
jgi:hypothetical protein